MTTLLKPLLRENNSSSSTHHPHHLYDHHTVHIVLLSTQQVSPLPSIPSWGQMFQPLPLLNHTSPPSPSPLPTLPLPPHQLLSTLCTRSIFCHTHNSLHNIFYTMSIPTRSHMMREHRPVLVFPHLHMCTPHALTPTSPWTSLGGRTEYQTVKGTVNCRLCRDLVVPRISHVTSPHTHTHSVECSSSML